MTPFQIAVPQAVLDDLRTRLERTRWPDQVAGAGWDYGTNLPYLQDLLGYWQHQFDWRAQERALNEIPQYLATVEGVPIHFLYVRGKGPDPLPLLILHGWPGSFYLLTRLIPLLTDPVAYGGAAHDSFDVIIPSLPGYGFSGHPTAPGMSVSRMARLFNTLMVDTLGYSRYAGRGTDLGAGILQQLALTSPHTLIGIHMGGTNPWLGEVPADLSAEEQQFVANARRWNGEEMAYAMEHSSKPQTLAYGLNDSPAGLAAWIVEKLRTWSDCNGDVEIVFTKDEILTNLTIYWVTETIGSSVRLYYESLRQPGAWGRADIPTAFAMPPRDMFPTPRAWVERSSRVDRWTELPRGGHFPDWEVPGPLAEDLRAFFRGLR